MVQGRLDYCNSLLHLSSSDNLQKLQRIQNSLARIVTGKHRHKHVTPILARLHWLPVKISCPLQIITSSHHFQRSLHTTAKLPGRVHHVYLVEISGQAITNGYTYIETNWSSPTVPSATQHRPFGMDFLLQSLPPVHWNFSNGRSKLNCTIVRLTVTDSWPPALKILPIVND